MSPILRASNDASREILASVEIILQAISHVYQTTPLSMNRHYGRALQFCEEAIDRVVHGGYKECWMDLINDHTRLLLIKFPSELKDAVATLQLCFCEKCIPGIRQGMCNRQIN